MDIRIDKRDCDIIYVDKNNLHSANTSNIIKLVSDNCDVAFNIATIFAGYIGLSKIETFVLKVCININPINYLTLVDFCAISFDKSKITIKRAIAKLKAKHIIYENDNYIYCNIAFDADKLNKSQFIIIEVKH